MVTFVQTSVLQRFEKKTNTIASAQKFDHRSSLTLKEYEQEHVIEGIDFALSCTFWGVILKPL